MQRMERTNLIMAALTVLMYGLSTVHIALAMRVDFVAFFDEHAIDGTGTGTIFNKNADPRVWMQVVLEIANVSSVKAMIGRMSCVAEFRR